MYDIIGWTRAVKDGGTACSILNIRLVCLVIKDYTMWCVCLVPLQPWRISGQESVLQDGSEVPSWQEPRWKGKGPIAEL